MSRGKLVLALAAAGLLAAPAMASGRDAKPEKTVSFATSWNEAVEEAQALNLPIVIHQHGFY